MRMRKLPAVDLYYRFRIAIQTFRCRLDDPGFSRAGGAKEQHRADRPIWRVHAGQKDLIKAAHSPYCSLLSHDAIGQALLEVLSARTFLIRIQEDGAHD